ncbi:MAG: hypothetical protein N3C61_02485 [Candidatus Micrarchaeota archaeon]|nr:hypothetical protein [Candidatus Micrarchaeota archaeon]
MSRFHMKDEDIKNKDVKKKFVGMWEAYIRENIDTRFCDFDQNKAKSKVELIFDKIMPELRDRIRKNLVSLDEEKFNKNYKQLLTKLFNTETDDQIPSINLHDQTIFDLGMHFRLYHLLMLNNLNHNEPLILRNILETVFEIQTHIIRAMNYNKEILEEIRNDDPRSLKNTLSTWKALVVPFSVNFNSLSIKYAFELIKLDLNGMIEHIDTLKLKEININTLKLNKKLIQISDKFYEILDKAYKFYRDNNFRSYLVSNRINLLNNEKFLIILRDLNNNFEQYKNAIKEFNSISNDLMPLLFYLLKLEIDKQISSSTREEPYDQLNQSMKA